MEYRSLKKYITVTVVPLTSKNHKDAVMIVNPTDSKNKISDSFKDFG